ncbi:MAG: glycosyltransferase family 9 protein [Candidatus Omnitrophota bacterium]
MKKVLIVKPDGIGDFVIFSAVLAEYARLYKDSQLDLLCHPNVKLLAEAMPYFNRIDCVEWARLGRKKGLFYKIGFHLRMLIRHYDLVIYPLYSREHKGDVIVRFLRAKEKVAFDGGPARDIADRVKRRNRWYARIITADPRECLEIERNAEFINKIGGNVSLHGLAPKLFFTQEDTLEFDDLCRSNRLKSKEYICFFPGAGMPIRHWDPKEWISLIGNLRRQRPTQTFVFLGGEADRGVVNKILSGLQADGCMVDLVGKLGLRLTAKVIEGAQLLVSMETSAVHIAAAVGTPNVCLIGGGHFGRFYPYGDLAKNRIVFKKMDCFGCNWNCRYSRIRCILEISHLHVSTEVERAGYARD